MNWLCIVQPKWLSTSWIYVKYVPTFKNQMSSSKKEKKFGTTFTLINSSSSHQLLGMVTNEKDTMQTSFKSWASHISNLHQCNKYQARYTIFWPLIGTTTKWLMKKELLCVRYTESYNIFFNKGIFAFIYTISFKHSK